MASCAYIAGMGIVSALGIGIEKTVQALLSCESCLSSTDIFQSNLLNPPLVGAVQYFSGEKLPRTHELAKMAAGQAMEQCRLVPDAVVLGVTTGGMLRCESLLKAGETDPVRFQHHGLGSVADHIAGLVGCTGPVITVATACSSGNVALKIGLELIRSGQADTVLAGGADSLCRMTCYGFQSLQVVDPAGARPFDHKRCGMSVAEGGAMLLLTSEKPENPIAELSGGGLTCDAFHASSPHPEGEGAIRAMTLALDDAGVKPEDIDYISLHGTGTPANDKAEALAVNRLFSGNKPAVSSVKGAMGHPMAAAGAIEAVISAIAVSRDMIPANAGFTLPDPDLNLVPEIRPLHRPVLEVLSNGFGFGGNNASLVISKVGAQKDKNNRARVQGADKSKEPARPASMSVLGHACVTGAGTTAGTLEAFYRGEPLSGMINDKELTDLVSLRKVRRLKRFSRLMLALSVLAREDAGPETTWRTVVGGTGWGSLSETWDFLSRLFANNEKFSSPMDFVGSVHNAALGQVAMELGAKGPNITTTGGDVSFEQALWTAGLMGENSGESVMVMGGDEYHPELSPRFDRSVGCGTTPSDGGGALVLASGIAPGRITITPRFFKPDLERSNSKASLAGLVQAIPDLKGKYGAVMAGIPGAFSSWGTALVDALVKTHPLSVPVLNYRNLTGQFATASAVAAVLAVDAVTKNKLPDPDAQGRFIDLKGRGILLLGLGRYTTAVEVMPG